MTLFIGIDLAWKGDKNHSGAAVLSGDTEGISLVEASEGLKTLSDVKGFVDRHSDSDTVIAVDAPLIINNLDGQRPCEKLITERFAAAHAGAFPTNLRLYPNASSVQLAQDLVARGFCHCPQPHTSALRGRWFFEVYPHPAHVVLFGRTKIIKYKKGGVMTQKCGLSKFRNSIRQYLGQSSPPLRITDPLSRLLGQPLSDLRGRTLKHYEDRIDALFCAYLAAYFWCWSYARNEMIGDMTTGYIINPKPEAA
jgi:predicted RNase H-like nuclease